MKQLRYIKSLLVLNGITQTELARELGTTRENVTNVLRGSCTSRRVKEHIAKRLGKDFDKLWGKAA